METVTISLERYNQLMKNSNLWLEKANVVTVYNPMRYKEFVGVFKVEQINEELKKANSEFKKKCMELEEKIFDMERAEPKKWWQIFTR